ncbi:MAG: DHH family phosphoesterase [Candidatus Woesearchaeota archaeon]|mgnify:CR=1|jgi:single-stranded DNA-specific DHH superfamily exonuclease|nr:DHH family phosphoesterase [Candidatus Woesearchaeota archaeon]MDP7623150.1 DHH family phosphoesterase [Candidatus Woesearchaeota archaeon]HJN56781.1 DHH family phosphoesterase [Candidatus Woesearchaeota archaeon]|tara:strand:+ start:6981 stop:8009 length:1029 start_codon:yes stop_codon:yes gene_type:complete
MLTEKHYEEIRDELKTCKNPLFFFDDDPDGLCSFLLLYRYVREGHGFVVKTHPRLDSKSVGKIEDYDADKAFVLDVACLEQDFIDNAKVPVIWIDHHGPFKRENVKYFNPRLIKQDGNIPTTYMCYKTAGQDIWIAMLGCIADYYMPDFVDEFKEKYPGLMDNEKKVEDIYFNTKLGELIKIYSFCLKGKTSDVMKKVKILTRIEHPNEILNQESSRGKFIFKAYEKIKNHYDDLLKSAISNVKDEKLLVFTYSDDKMSFTGDLANELLYKFPDKIIIVARRKEDDMRMSIRSSKKIIPPILEKSLIGLEGYGGGHELACGANVKQHQFEEFVERMKKKVSD